MTQIFLVFSKDTCPLCTQAKDLIRLRGDQCVEASLSNTKSLDAFKETYPELKKVPQIFKLSRGFGSLDTELLHIGGFTDLQEYFRKQDDDDQ